MTHKFLLAILRKQDINQIERLCQYSNKKAAICKAAF